MSSSALPYAEGDVFLIPLRSGGYARGVVARAAPKGKVLFGYFFGPLVTSVDSATLSDVEPSQSILRVRFGDLALLNGAWPIYGKVPHWDRTKWSMPAFVRKDPLRRKPPNLVRYSDDDPSRIEAEEIASDIAGFGPDSLSGYGAVEIQLSKLLGQ